MPVMQSLPQDAANLDCEPLLSRRPPLFFTVKRVSYLKPRCNNIISVSKAFSVYFTKKIKDPSKTDLFLKKHGISLDISGFTPLKEADEHSSDKILILNDKCDHAFISVVDHLLDCFSKSFPSVWWNGGRFEPDAFLHHFMQRRAEELCLP